MCYDSADTAPQLIEVLALHSDDFQSVAGQSLGDVVSREVLRWVSGDSYVIVIDEELDVQALRNSKPGSLGVVAFLLRAVGAQAEDGLVAIGEGDTVDERPR